MADTIAKNRLTGHVILNINMLWLTQTPISCGQRNVASPARRPLSRRARSALMAVPHRARTALTRARAPVSFLAAKFRAFFPVLRGFRECQLTDNGEKKSCGGTEIVLKTPGKFWAVFLVFQWFEGVADVCHRQENRATAGFCAEITFKTPKKFGAAFLCFQWFEGVANVKCHRPRKSRNGWWLAEIILKMSQEILEPLSLFCRGLRGWHLNATAKKIA